MKTKKFDFFVTIVTVIVVIVLRPISIYHWVDAYPTELLEIDDEKDSTYVPSWQIDDVNENEDENDVVRREEALENLQKIFGIRGHLENKPSIRNKIPPQFMMELYNTIADSSGVTRGKNPYNAKVVRSFIERETLFSHLYLFNISGLEINESVLEAELHLYRKRTSLKVIHPTVLKSPYYLIRVYQVLEGKSMAEPDLHRLLNVHYVGAHASGWQVFNVKQAVLAWVSGAPNLGLMVTASNLFDDVVTVEFSRRNDYHNSKQPILVLFDDDGRGPTPRTEKLIPHYYTYDNESEDFDSSTYDRRDSVNKEIKTSSENNESENLPRRKRHRELSLDSSNSPKFTKTELNEEQSYGTQVGDKNLYNGKTEYFQRFKRIENDERKNDKKMFPNDEESSLELSSSSSLRYKKNYQNNEKNDESKSEEKSQGFFRQRRAAIEQNDRRETRRKIEAKKKFVSDRRTRAPQILVSMDIYERAMLRERMTSDKKKGEKNERKREMNYSSSVRDKRSLRATTDSENEKSSDSNSSERRSNTTECSRRELYVDFKEIGLSTSIIAPKGYSAYHCQGICDTPLSQDQQPTNHATVQGIVHKMGLVADVHMPCCVPTKLVSTTILFFDDNENVVLKVYEDMIADRCGCR